MTDHPPVTLAAANEASPARPHPGGWHSFRTGLTLAARYPVLILLAWAANLLLALVLAALPALALATGPGDRPVMRDMADGVDTWLWIESLMSPQAQSLLLDSSPGAELSIGLGPVVLWTMLALLLVPLLGWVAGAFLQGGILRTYRDAPQRFGWRRFLSACWHWWAPFLLLGAVQGLAALVFLLPLVVGAAGVLVAGQSLLGWLLIALALAVDLVGLALFEWTRVLAVATGSRHVLRCLGQAVPLLIRHAPPVAVLYLLTLAAAALLHAVYRLALVPVLPFDAWLLVLVVAQSFVAARILLRLVRLAGVTTLAGAAGPRPAEAPVKAMP